MCRGLFRGVINNINHGIAGLSQPGPAKERQVMNNAQLYITSEDNIRLRMLLAAAPDGARNPLLNQLRFELERASVVDDAAVPPDVVKMGSRVEIEDLHTGEVETYTLAFPEQSNIDKNLLSVLAPIGTAIIGCSEGMIVNWQTPGGTRRFKIHRVTQTEGRPAAVPAATLDQILGRAV
jgi:regulator of nucleoside diphosphate kinase